MGFERYGRPAIVIALPLTMALACSGERRDGDASPDAAPRAGEAAATRPAVGPAAAPPETARTESREREHGPSAGPREKGEHAGAAEPRKGGRPGAGDGAGDEESGTRLGRGEVWDATRRGARLVLKFDSASGRFTGRAENTTASTLCAVRVEVHLTAGAELGPTSRTDLRPGQSVAVILPTNGAPFDTWTAHPEVSACPRK